METNIYEKEFVSGKTTISRSLLESFPVPFCTEGVDDETMQRVADDVEVEMLGWYELCESGDVSSDKVDEVWWEMLEKVCNEVGIPYYEDMAVAE